MSPAFFQSPARRSQRCARPLTPPHAWLHSPDVKNPELALGGSLPARAPAPAPHAPAGAAVGHGGRARRGALAGVWRRVPGRLALAACASGALGRMRAQRLRRP